MGLHNQDQQKKQYNSGSVHNTPEKLVLPEIRFRLIRIKKLPFFMINRNTVKTQETKSWGAGNTKKFPAASPDRDDAGI